MDTQILKSNLKEIFSKKTNLISLILSGSLLFLLFSLIRNNEIMIGNFGYTYFYTVVSFEIVISILFAIFFTATLHKFRKFSTLSAGQSSASAIATFISILTAGCVSCSITIASYLGLASLIALLPYDGIELKILALILLILATFNIIKSLNVCEIKKRKKKI